MKDEVGITVATHGWIGTEMSRGRFMVEEGAEMQWKEEREVSFLHLIVHFHYGTYFYHIIIFINFRGMKSLDNSKQNNL